MNRNPRHALRVLALFLLSFGVLLPSVVAQTTAPAAPPISDPFMALPESEMVLVIDIQRILNDAVPRFLASNPEMLKKMNDSLDSLKAMSGIDFRAPSRLIVGAPAFESDPTKSQIRAVLIAQVNDADKMMSLFILASGSPEFAGKITEQKYEGETLYVLPKGTYKGSTPEKERKLDFDVAVTALDAGTILFGTPAEVRAAIDASTGRRPRANAELVAAATRNPNALLGMAMNVPDSFKSQVFGKKEGQSGEGESENEIVKALSAVNRVSAALGLTPAGFDVLLAGRTTTNDQAKNLSDMLNGLKALATLSPPKDVRERMIQNAIKSVQVFSESNELQLKTEITREMIDTFVQEVKQEVDKANQSPTTKKKPPVRRTRRTKTRRRA
ncbi:MAG TPA: hypothetical protein VF666_14795 [Pyrinomonadaceae bacterium]|jgi:hypothetical protein